MNTMRKASVIISIILLASTATAFSFNMENAKAAYIDLSGTISASGPSSAFSSTGITPEVCRFRDVAASGAYLFSLGCDEIVADEASLTGSIGVRGSYLEFSEALEEYGIEYVNISAGEFKGVGSPYQNATEEDREILQERASEIHQQFLNLVKEKRNLTQSQIDDVGDGRVILGTEASEKGLVDHLGGREKSENVAGNLTDSSLSFESLSTTESFNFFSLLSASISEGLNTVFSEAPITAKL